MPVTQPRGGPATLTALPPGGGFTSLSCISDTFCVAAGGGTSGDHAELTTGSGVAVSWDGAAWSDPSVYYPAPATGPVTAPVLPAVACTSGPSCVIVDGSGHVSAGDGTTWSAPAAADRRHPVLPADPADPGPGHPGSRSAAVSCPGAGLCAFVDNTGHVYTLRSGRWLAPQSFGAAGCGPRPTVALYQAGRVGVSCPISSSCTAVVGASVLDWDGYHLVPGAGALDRPRWPRDHRTHRHLLPDHRLCLVGERHRGVVRSAGTGGRPSRPSIPAVGSTRSRARPPRSAWRPTRAARWSSWNGTTWSAPDQVIPAATEYTGIGTSVSCPTAQFCMVMNSDGDYATYRRPRPRARA